MNLIPIVSGREKYGEDTFVFWEEIKHAIAYISQIDILPEMFDARLKQRNTFNINGFWMMCNPIFESSEFPEEEDVGLVNVYPIKLLRK